MFFLALFTKKLLRIISRAEYIHRTAYGYLLKHNSSAMADDGRECETSWLVRHALYGQPGSIWTPLGLCTRDQSR